MEIAKDVTTSGTVSPTGMNQLQGQISQSKPAKLKLSDCVSQHAIDSSSQSIDNISLLTQEFVNEEFCINIDWDHPGPSRDVLSFSQPCICKSPSSPELMDLYKRASQIRNLQKNMVEIDKNDTLSLDVTFEWLLSHDQMDEVYNEKPSELKHADNDKDYVKLEKVITDVTGSNMEKQNTESEKHELLGKTEISMQHCTNQTLHTDWSSDMHMQSETVILNQNQEPEQNNFSSGHDQNTDIPNPVSFLPEKSVGSEQVPGLDDYIDEGNVCDIDTSDTRNKGEDGVKLASGLDNDLQEAKISATDTSDRMSEGEGGAKLAPALDKDGVKAKIIATATSDTKDEGEDGAILAPRLDNQVGEANISATATSDTKDEGEDGAKLQEHDQSHIVSSNATQVDVKVCAKTESSHKDEAGTSKVENIEKEVDKVTGVKLGREKSDVNKDNSNATQNEETVNVHTPEKITEIANNVPESENESDVNKESSIATQTEESSNVYTPEKQTELLDDIAARGYDLNAENQSIKVTVENQEVTTEKLENIHENGKEYVHQLSRISEGSERSHDIEVRINVPAPRRKSPLEVTEDHFSEEENDEEKDEPPCPALMSVGVRGSNDEGKSEQVALESQTTKHRSNTTASGVEIETTFMDAKTTDVPQQTGKEKPGKADYQPVASTSRVSEDYFNHLKNAMSDNRVDSPSEDDIYASWFDQHIPNSTPTTVTSSLTSDDLISGILPCSSSVVDMTVLVHRIIGFVQTVCQTLFPFSKSFAGDINATQFSMSPEEEAAMETKILRDYVLARKQLYEKLLQVGNNLQM